MRLEMTVVEICLPSKEGANLPEIPKYAKVVWTPIFLDDVLPSFLCILPRDPFVTSASYMASLAMVKNKGMVVD